MANVVAKGFSIAPCFDMMPTNILEVKCEEKFNVLLHSISKVRECHLVRNVKVVVTLVLSSQMCLDFM